MKKALQLKGVKKIDMDFDNGLFTLLIDGKTALKPSDIQKSVPKRFSIDSVAVEGLAGTARKDGDKVLFKAKNFDLEYEVVKAKEAKAYDELVAKLGEGKTEFKLGGSATEEKVKKDDTEETVLKITVESVSIVEAK